MKIVFDKQPLPKDRNEAESKETFLSDFGKLSQRLSKEEREAALREVGQMQKDGLIKVSSPKPVKYKVPEDEKIDKEWLNKDEINPFLFFFFELV
jgi:hypothetical protein